MSKNYSKKRRLKYVFVALACAASFSLTGLAAACNTDEKTEDEKTTSREDTQLLKNGNFEFFDVPEQKDGENAPEYLINTPDNWTRGGTSSYTMSGIIGTSDEAWKRLTADDLAERLDANNALDSSAADYKDLYVDFNGMKSSDLLYKDTYAALKYDTISESTENNVTTYYIGEGDSKIEIYKDGDKYYYDEAKTNEVTKDFIANPLTHNIFTEDGEPYLLDANGDKQEIYVDENGDYFLYDNDKEDYSKPAGHVLMLHNYSNSNHNGIAQNYASVNVSLPANTSAAVSVWVKTSNLLYSNGKNANDDQDHGANITVTHTAGSTTLDDFKITSINTEKLFENEVIEDKYNGWIEYTVYINACNFASSTITIKLGLGESDHLTEGYAFFDDVTVTQYAQLDDCPSYTSDIQNKIKADGAECTLTSDASEKIFVADTLERPTAGGMQSSDRFSKDFHFLLDLASEDDYQPIDLTSAKAGLTVDSDYYVSSTSNMFNSTLGQPETPDKTLKLPDDLKNISVNGGNGLDVSQDLITLVKAGQGVSAGATKYAQQLNDAITSAKDLPNGSENDDTLVIFSAKGAAYTASFDIEVEKESYKIISFWVKTSDMGGFAAANVKITEDGNKDNTASVALDSTDIVTDIDDDNKDIYNGWVQCFFFVHNENDEAAKLNVEFCFGNTTINGTTITSYKAGWASLANVKILDVDEDVYSYTGSGNYTDSLTITEEDKKTTAKFDEVYGSLTHEIENGIVDPASYSGTNGGSSNVVYNGFEDVYANPNSYAGLINKDYFGNYSGDWYDTLLSAFNASSTEAVDNWNTVFGSKSVQPLIIINKIRQYEALAEANADNYTDYYIEITDDNYSGAFVETENGRKFRKATKEDGFDEDTEYYSLRKVLNYGFIGNEQTVSSDGFTTVSIRVKVSEGAVAYVYLVDTSDSANVLTFNTPSYTFRYDEDGNVLKADIDEKASIDEQRANVLYTPRTDGLYEDKDGKLYANIWNYTELYTDESKTYFDKDGNAVNFEKLVEGESYYTDETHQLKANHFLVTSDGVKVFEFREDGNYHYIVDGVSQKEAVYGFDVSYAKYDYSALSEEYVAVIGDTQGKWVTVNFVIHAGSESKSYRLELWSGQRENTGLDENGNPVSDNKAGGAVIFDYSYTSISSDDMLNRYESKIIRAYQEVLADNNLLSDIPTSAENIDYYKNLVDGYVAEGKIDEADVNKYEVLKNFKAHYYTYSLYDSATYVPFNKDAADENATGYDYTVSNYTETLAYLEVTDYDTEDATELYTYTVFADYSTIDQSITLDLGSEDEEEDTEDEEEDTDTANVWLLASSIILVIALLFAMIAILLKDSIKKLRHKKVFSKNNYDNSKTNRYIRKLRIKKEEIEEVEAEPAKAPAPAPSEPAEKPADTQPSETQPAEEVTEQPAEVQPVEESPSETQPAEEVTEQPETVETEEPAKEENAESSEKPEDGQE